MIFPLDSPLIVTDDLELICPISLVSSPLFLLQLINGTKRRDLFCARDPAKLVNKIMMDFQEKGSVLEATNSLNYFLYLCIPLSRYSCMSLPNTYDNDRTYKNDTNTLS